MRKPPHAEDLALEFEPARLNCREQRAHRGHAAARPLHQRTYGGSVQGMHSADREDLIRRIERSLRDLRVRARDRIRKPLAEFACSLSVPAIRGEARSA